MPGINHLIASNAAPGTSRVDGVDADRMNSIVERISGVNPSKLAARVTGESVQPGASEPSGMSGFPVSGTPLQQTMGQQQPLQDPYAQQTAPSAAVSPDAMAKMQQLYERVQYLEQRVAYYEAGNGSEGEQYRGQGNDARAWAPKMDPKKKQRKDPIDGKPDDEVAQEGRMGSDPLAALGLSMTECLDLAGVLEGSEPQARPQVRPPPQQQEPVQTLAEDLEEINEEIDEDLLWEWFLEGNGISVEQLDALVDDAMARDDREQMGMILALEDRFHEQMAAAQHGTQQLGQAAMKTPKPSAPKAAPAAAPKPAPTAVKPMVTPAVKPKMAKSPAMAAPKVQQVKPAAPAAGAMRQTVKKVAAPAPKTSLTARKEHLENIEFEADAGPDGMPHNIPWERILKAYRVKQAPSPSDKEGGGEKDERGFGSQNQVGPS